ncbi:MAG: hypothetical protein V7603_4904 [Micromonosporaceae bacterium]|jgi:predicted 3-demethylubiquinone-9 3-methyltransferase (glyoxalase superfamily)
MQKITTYLWFDSQAAEAADHYASIFEDARILNVHRTGGAVLTVTFELAGQQFIALNGGPQFPFTEAISLYVDCGSQEEVDALWAKLSEGGEEGSCGWLKDKFGVSWQVIPRQLPELLGGSDPVRAERAMKAMLQMKKIDIQGLVDAYEQ